MKIIVTYASAGAGHFKAAEALYAYLKEHHREIDVTLIDILEKTNVLFRAIYTHGYLFMIKYALFVWRLGFWISYVKSLRLVSRPIASVINRLNTKNFAKFLIQENPDWIISTHFLPSEISVYLKKTRKINSRVVSVITDFGIHPFWISEGTDMYIAALDSTKEWLIREGIKEEKIKVFGIPVDSKFLKEYDKGILCKKIGIEQNKFTILIATGSFGIGPIEEIVDLLYKEVQVLVVCANNKILYKKLKNKNYPNTKIFGFIDNIQELMAVSQIIITKPGGLSISESLVMDLLPIFIMAIPGQETQNLKALAHCGIGIYPRNVIQIRDIAIYFREHPDKLKNIKEDIGKIKKPNALREICNVVCQSSGGSSG